MTSGQIYQLVSILILAALLFIPVSKLVWALSVRRLQRKLGKELSPQEITSQLQRARFIAFIAVLIFSYLFNTIALEKIYG